MNRLFAAVRAVVYASLLVWLWSWLALLSRRYDLVLGGPLPSWAVPLGLVLIVPGALVVLWCLVLFVTEGRGTPAPFDPPRAFVAKGPYRLVRNPMYEGAFLVLAGLGFAWRSAGVLALALVAVVSAHVFVILVEEPGLKDRFGESYRGYLASTNRWLPRLAKRAA